MAVLRTRIEKKKQQNSSKRISWYHARKIIQIQLTSRTPLDDPIFTLVQLDTALGAIPLGRARGDFGQTHAVEMEPFTVTLQRVKTLAFCQNVS